MIRFHGNVAYSNKQTRKTQPISKSAYREIVIVDGTNVAYHTGKPPKISHIKKVRAALIKAKIKPIIFVSNALRYKIDDPIELQKLINAGIIIETEPDRDDDLAVIEEAIAKRARIITNDRFLQHRTIYGTKYDFHNLIRYSINDKVIFFR